MTCSPLRVAPFNFARRVVTAVAIATFIVVANVPHVSLAEAANCQFAMGFKTLHDLIPTIVGDCVTNEIHVVNGDAVQSTTHGLLAWRKADNHTAFTDGYRTWVNGPFGVQERLNTQRFAWEQDAPPAGVDPRLSAAYQIAAASRFSSLIANVVAQHIPVGIAALNGAFGDFSIDPQSGREAIIIDQSLVGAEPSDAADVLIHEATHAYDSTHLPNFGTSAGCFTTEFNAKENDLTFWGDQFGPTGKQPPANQFETQEDAQILLAQANLRALLQATLNAYRAECGLG